MKKIIILLFCLCNCSALGWGQEESANVLSWEGCIAEALQNNPELLAARESYIQTQMSEKIAKSSLFPQISGSFSGSGTETEGQSTENYSYGVSASQLLFDGFKTQNTVKEANQKVLAAEFEYAVNSSNVRLSLRKAYVHLLKAQELLSLTTEIIQMREQSLRLISLRYESGKEHKGSLLTSQANLAQAKLEHKEAQRNLEYAQRQLSKELGRTSFVPVVAEGELTVNPLLEEKPDFDQLVETTPYLKQLSALTEASEYSLKATKAEYWPQIYATGSRSTSGEWSPDRDSWSIGFSVSIPIFEGGKKKTQVSQAKSSLKETELNERSGKDGMVLTLVDAWVSFVNAVDAVSVQQKYLEASETRSKISEAQYTNGLITYDDWIIIEDALVDAKKQYLSSKVNAFLAEANWIQAKGGILENDEEI